MIWGEPPLFLETSNSTHLLSLPLILPHQCGPKWKPSRNIANTSTSPCLRTLTCWDRCGVFTHLDWARANFPKMYQTIKWLSNTSNNNTSRLQDRILQCNIECVMIWLRCDLTSNLFQENLLQALDSLSSRSIRRIFFRWIYRQKDSSCSQLWIWYIKNSRLVGDLLLWMLVSWCIFLAGPSLVGNEGPSFIPQPLLIGIHWGWNFPHSERVGPASFFGCLRFNAGGLTLDEALGGQEESTEALECFLGNLQAGFNLVVNVGKMLLFFCFFEPPLPVIVANEGL